MTINRLCTWVGHNYRPRFDKSACVYGGDMNGFSARDTLEVLEQYRQSTYVRDVCTRCGATIERLYDNAGREIPQ